MKSRKAAWIIAATLPIWFIPLWLGIVRLTGFNFIGLGTATGGLLTVLVLVAAYTDSQYWRIPNWLTYTGTLWALAINSGQSLVGNETSRQMLGAVGIGQSLLGFAALFFGLLIVCSFSGGGAGDVKMGGAIGSFLGLKNGFEAFLITYVACAVVVMLQTAVNALRADAKQEEAENDQGAQLLGEEKQSKVNFFRRPVPLAPFFALGTIAVLLRESGLFEFSVFGK